MVNLHALSKHGHTCSVDPISDWIPILFQVKWHFMGFNFHGRNICVQIQPVSCWIVLFYRCIYIWSFLVCIVLFLFHFFFFSSFFFYAYLHCFILYYFLYLSNFCHSSNSYRIQSICIELLKHFVCSFDNCVYQKILLSLWPKILNILKARSVGCWYIECQNLCEVYND
jgi:hypothetical protein